VSRAKNILYYLKLSKASSSEMDSERTKVNHMLRLKGRGPEAFDEFEREVQIYLNRYSKERGLKEPLVLRDLINFGFSESRVAEKRKFDPYYFFESPYDYIFESRSPFEYFNYLKSEGLIEV
jgi:hypothetical protein